MAVPSSKIPRFLIVRRDNIGDLVCTTPLIDALRERYPEAWIAALVNTYNCEVLARNPALDVVFAYEKMKHRSAGLASNIVRAWKLMRRVRAEKADCVLVPSATAQSLRIAKGLRPRRIIQNDPHLDEGKHEVERVFALGESLDLRKTPGPLRVFPDPEARARLSQQLGPEPFVAVHISARQARRRWPLQRYAELIRVLSKEERVMLLWSPGPDNDPRHPGDDAAAAELMALTRGARVEALPTPDLRTAIAVLSIAGRVVCPDGGIVHLASALGKPVVALFAEKNQAERWRPWGVEHRVVRPDSGDLADLELGPVLEAYRSLGSQNRHGAGR